MLLSQQPPRAWRQVGRILQPLVDGRCSLQQGNAVRTSRTLCSSSRGRGYPGEHAFNLSEYMVVLDKPIGLTLAPDLTGKIVVQDIRPQSPADLCQLIQVGDIVKLCSAVFGDEMWQATDIRRVKWSINNRTGKVKLILERRQASGTCWYMPGVVGCCSRESVALQLPVNFAKVESDEWPQDASGPGKSLAVAFHRNTQVSHLAVYRTKRATARSSKLTKLREDLQAARSACAMSVTLNPPRADAAAEGVMLPFAAGLVQTQATFHLPASSAGGSGSGYSSSRVASTASWAIKDDCVPQPSGPGAGMISSPSSHAATSPSGEKKVVAVLPWLLVATGHLDPRSIAAIAGQRGLSAVLELNLVRSPYGLAVRGTEATQLSQDSQPFVHPSSTAVPCSGGSLPNTTINSGVGSVRPPSILSSAIPITSTSPLAQQPQQQPQQASVSASTESVATTTPTQPGVDAAAIKLLLHAASSLQRLSCRRSGGMHHAQPEHCAVLLQCEPGLEPEVATLLAGWLHWYCCLPLQEASLAAEVALLTSVNTAVLEAATTALIEGAKGRASKVVITWKYGGLSAFVAGDIVGSWANRVPLLRCKNVLGCKGSTARGHFFLEIYGLQPGVYYYKYIIDGTWTVDPNSSKVLDSAGNWNNVLEVHELPPILTTKEGLALARWHAAHLAYENKLGLPATGP